MPSFSERLDGYWYSDEFPKKVITDIESGADVNEPGMLTLIIEYCKDDRELLRILKLMLDRGLKVSDSIVLDLIRYCHVECLEFFEGRGLDINFRDAQHCNGLFYLVRTDLPYDRFINGLSAFIAMGVDCDQLLKDNRNLIHHTVSAGISEQYLDTVCGLGLDINQKDNNGWTPLHVASKNLSTGYIRILLQNGADKSLRIQAESNTEDYGEALSPGLTALQIYEKEAPVGAIWREEEIVRLLSE